MIILVCTAMTCVLSHFFLHHALAGWPAESGLFTHTAGSCCIMWTGSHGCKHNGVPACKECRWGIHRLVSFCYFVVTQFVSLTFFSIVQCVLICSISVQEIIDELERKLVEAVRLQSAAVQDRDKLLPMIAVAQTEDDHHRRQSTHDTVRDTFVASRYPLSVN